MQHVSNLLLVALVSVLFGCGGSNEGSISSGSTDQPALAGQGSSTQSSDTDQDDPNNPWVLGFRWSGSPDTEFRVILATRDVNYDRLKSQGQSPFRTNSFDFKVQEDHNVFLATVFVKGLKLRATIESEGRTLQIEMVDGRMADPSNPFGGVEVRNVLSSAEASGNGAVIELESGEPIETTGENW